MPNEKHVVIVGREDIGNWPPKPCTFCRYICITVEHYFCTRLEDSHLYNLVTGGYKPYKGKRVACKDQRGGTTEDCCGIAGKFYAPK